ncbi:MAG: putative zinc-binding metallopeptidase [Candidatus Omnitrophota bacterium]|nr:putative zinc-binding metallopeptidase [Candidatus Omnitrophota bacterium]
MKKKIHINIEEMNDETLLSVRMCDLGLEIKDTWLESCVDQLYRELDSKGIKIHPPCYIADEWLCPDGEPVIGIAFFLAHPRLKKLEQTMMLEVEGGDRKSCMQLLRHEAGHAVNYAYILHKRKQWRAIFGEFSAEYGDRYKYRPYSKSFVRHLEDWYAQYHPDEDFAETFAVWLDGESDWENKYKGWKALTKLKYVDKLMKEVSEKKPKVAKGEKFWQVANLKTTLATYYKRKKMLYAESYADFHDMYLMRIFPSENAKGDKAFKLIKHHSRDMLDEVALWTGEKKFIVNRLIKDVIDRCRDLGLKTGKDRTGDMLKVTTYVTTQIMNYVYTGRYRRRNEKNKSSRTV